MNDFPPELVVLVFEHLAAASAPCMSPDLHHARRVCQRWDEVIRTTPYLWTIVNFDLHHVLDALRLQTWLSRTKDLPLELVWTGNWHLHDGIQAWGLADGRAGWGHGGWHSLTLGDPNSLALDDARAADNDRWRRLTAILVLLLPRCAAISLPQLFTVPTGEQLPPAPFLRIADIASQDAHFWDLFPRSNISNHAGHSTTELECTTKATNSDFAAHVQGRPIADYAIFCMIVDSGDFLGKPAGFLKLITVAVPSNEILCALLERLDPRSLENVAENTAQETLLAFSVCAPETAFPVDPLSSFKEKQLGDDANLVFAAGKDYLQSQYSN
ncbi:hypothetical protein C8R44DRAFT_894616 [Mycena epipterygia]|nr:hypothetical protein C8R44DRAFT_894616 [Mycena epipterygia]